MYIEQKKPTNRKIEKCFIRLSCFLFAFLLFIYDSYLKSIRNMQNYREMLIILLYHPIILWIARYEIIEDRDKIHLYEFFVIIDSWLGSMPYQIRIQKREKIQILLISSYIPHQIKSVPCEIKSINDRSQ